ncbi:hypothetical protein OBBRIDRAFT_808794 [Obba rivulosa]|uniref:Uncharacterized protein n=1 Tax=Obba rivulosa TaxID=1052685 RepID=A0A8E2DFE8_9APHY|nr:hypothetical protein OBBRIDRAFT_808794 [Obba rivulosa]
MSHWLGALPEPFTSCRPLSQPFAHSKGKKAAESGTEGVKVLDSRFHINRRVLCKRYTQAEFGRPLGKPAELTELNMAAMRDIDHKYDILLMSERPMTFENSDARSQTVCGVGVLPGTEPGNLSTCSSRRIWGKGSDRLPEFCSAVQSSLRCLSVYLEKLYLIVAVQSSELVYGSDPGHTFSWSEI